MKDKVIRYALYMMSALIGFALMFVLVVPVMWILSKTRPKLWMEIEEMYDSDPMYHGGIYVGRQVS